MYRTTVAGAASTDSTATTNHTVTTDSSDSDVSTFSTVRVKMIVLDHDGATDNWVWESVSLQYLIGISTDRKSVV